MKRFFLAAALIFCAATALAKTPEDAWNEAADFLQQGDYENAISKYREGIELNPGSAIGYNLLGTAYRLRYSLKSDPRDQSESLAAFKKGTEIDPDYWVSFYNLGYAQYRAGDKGEAARNLKKVLDLYPQHPERPDLEKIISEGASSENSQPGVKAPENS